MSTLDYAKARELMVEQQVRPWDVLDARVLDALSAIPRASSTSQGRTCCSTISSRALA